MTDHHKSRKSRRERRGVGAIMGGVILVSILVSSVLLYYMTILDNDGRKASYDIQSAQINQDKASEELTAYRDQDLFTDGTAWYISAHMSNDGSLPLVITHILLYCTSPACAAPDEPVPITTFLPETPSLPLTLNSQEQMSKRIPISDDNDLTYRIDFITERGNIVSAPECAVDLTDGVCTNDPNGGVRNFLLTASPDSLVIERGRSGESIVTVTSLNGFDEPVQVDVSGQPADITVTPASNTVTPSPGDSVSYTLTIDVESNAPPGTHTLTLTGTSPSITRTTRIAITVLGDLQVDPRLIQQPQIQPLFPNPFGRTSNNGPQALWGAVIANPTEHPMNIRKLVISIYNPIGVQSPLLCNDAPTPVSPATGWVCVSNNVVEWRTNGAPITIPGYSTQLFLVRLGNPNPNNNELPSVTVNYNIFTDYGQFTKVGYDVGIRGPNVNHPIVNVFLSRNVADMSPANVIGTVDVQEGQDVTVNASIANFVPGTTVDAGARLIIDVPKAFSNVRVNSATGFNSCVPTGFSDGSTQINCALTNALTGTAPNHVRTVQFTMTAPTNILATKQYLLYVLGDGTSEGQTFTVGPVAESVIRVIPAP